MDCYKTTLEPAEDRFLHRQLSNEKSYLYFSIVGVVVALGLLVYYLMAGLLDGVHFALIMVILIGARGNLKQHKDAQLLSKFYETEMKNAELMDAGIKDDPNQKNELVG